MLNYIIGIFYCTVIWQVSLGRPFVSYTQAIKDSLCPKLRSPCCTCEEKVNTPIGHSGDSHLFCAPWFSWCLLTRTSVWTLIFVPSVDTGQFSMWKGCAVAGWVEKDHRRVAEKISLHAECICEWKFPLPFRGLLALHHAPTMVPF